jgi:ribosomal-protein-alanine N-acetyltransferase
MLDYSNLPYRVEPMVPQDVATIMEIENVSFSAPWSARAYDYELRYNEMAHYFVARLQQQPAEAIPPKPVFSWRRWFERGTRLADAANVVGYAGFWLMVDEAHISTIATHPQWRRRGIGELMLIAMIDAAVAIGARWMTLEVRVSNTGAQALYRKFGFDVTGMRRHYYTDNNEDALIMTTPLITTIEYQMKLDGLRGALFSRLSR